MPAALKTFVAVVIRWALSLRIVRALLLYTEKRGPVLADSVTYRALFSVFAAVLLGFSAAALWLAGNPEAWNALVSAVNSVIPGLIGGENAVIREEDLRSGLDQFQSGLSIAAIAAVIGLLFAAIGAVGTLRSALHLIGGTVMDDGLFLWVILRNFAMAA